MDPATPDQYIKDLPLEDLKRMLTALRGQLCARLELLRMAQNSLQIGTLDWEDVFFHFRTVAIQLWMEMLNLTLVLRYLSGQPLQEELQERRAFIQESVIPVMDMFLLEVRDKQVRRPVLYMDYLITSRTQGTVRGDASQASADGAFRTPAEEKTEQIEGRVEVLTLEPTIPASELQEIVRAQHERAAILTMGQSKAEKIKSENLQKILLLLGLSAKNKIKMISQLTNPEKKPGDQLEALAGRFNFRTDEASAAAYGDEKAVAQYNALPNVQLPPFYEVDKNPKIPQIMKLHLLQKSLKGNEEYLTHQITFSPTSYETLKENVKDAFDEADAALRLLTDQLRSWPILKRNDYKQLAEFAGFATNYVMQLMHFKGGAAFNPRNVVNDLYGKCNPQMMGDYCREWAQEELMKGKRSDRDQVVWLLEWLKEKLKVAKAY